MNLEGVFSITVKKKGELSLVERATDLSKKPKNLNYTN